MGDRCYGIRIFYVGGYMLEGEKMSKVPLYEAKMQGGLKDLKQVYRINFMPQEMIEGKEYSPKIELAILLEKDGVQDGAYRSLRFTNMAELQGFLYDMIKAYIFFGKQTGYINVNNFIFKKDKIKQFVEDSFRK